jgi:CBS domain-containing protein
MTRNVVFVLPIRMRGEVEALFRRYGFRAIPVVDGGHKILSVIKEKGLVVSED